MHLSSLPGPHGIGDLGPAAHGFIDWLVAAGQTFWQMLPVGPIGCGFSPYSSTSAFAGEPLYISIEGLEQDGLLDRSEIPAFADQDRCHVDFEAVAAFKKPLFRIAHSRFRERFDQWSGPYERFIHENASWLEHWIDFVGNDRDYETFLQFMFDHQWSNMHRHARDRGILLLGDVPIFVVADSADVKSNPELFRLDQHGNPEVLTGTPPDQFTDTGQLWGHPHYQWGAHQASEFRWWRDRIRVQLERFDALRIDHFIGFHHAYEIQADASDATSGTWVEAPGRDFFGCLQDAHGVLPLIAEDLGVMTPEIVSMRDDFGFPGMRVLHNAFGEEDSPDLPHNHPHCSVAYTGTHDNDTTVGWWATLPDEDRDRAILYGGLEPGEIHIGMIRLALTSPANTAIVPIQDLLGLGSDARMNIPGTAEGNWTWRLDGDLLSSELAESYREECRTCGRMREHSPESQD